MNSASESPILVTGSHHGGTTWLGRSICTAGNAGFLWEPFSRDNVPPWFSQKPDRWFVYPPEEPERWRREVGDLLAGQYHLAQKLRYVRNFKLSAKLTRDALSIGAYRRFGNPFLFKDPIAVFASAWLADTFAFRVVVSVRHPAAFVASILRTGNAHPWGDFAEQPRLMAGPLRGYADLVTAYTLQPPSLEDGAILLWKMIYHFVSDAAAERGDWLIVRHEDLCREPRESFAEVFQFLGMSPKRSLIERLASSVKREDERWRVSLSREQVEKIRRSTAPIWERFYAGSEW